MKKLIAILALLLAIPNLSIAKTNTATMYNEETGDRKVVIIGSAGIWGEGWRLETPTDNLNFWLKRLNEGNLNQEEVNRLPNKALDLVTPKIIQVLPREDVLGSAEPKMLVCRGQECDKYLANEVDDQLGYSVISRYKTTLRSSMSSTQNTVPASSMATFDGHTITSADYGAKAFLVIEPGSSREEIVKATGNTSTDWTGVTRGLAFYGTTETSVAANREAHNAGSILVMSNTHYVYEQLIDVDTNQTLTGDFTIASSTDDDLQTIIYGTSTPSQVKNLNGVLYYCNYGASCAAIGGGANTYNFVNPLTTSGSDVKLATSTYWFGLEGTKLEMATSTVSGGTASGVGLDDWWNTRQNATTTKNDVLTLNDGFLSKASSTITANLRIDGNATTTGSFALDGNFCAGSSCVPNDWHGIYYATSSNMTWAAGSFTSMLSKTTDIMQRGDTIHVVANIANVSGTGDAHVALRFDSATTTEYAFNNVNQNANWDFYVTMQDIGKANIKGTSDHLTGMYTVVATDSDHYYTTVPTTTIDFSDGVRVEVVTDSGDMVLGYGHMLIELIRGFSN